MCIDQHSGVRQSHVSSEKQQIPWTSLSVHPGFLSVHALTSANWDTVGHSSLWNERNQATTGQTSVESACVFHRQKDNTSVSNTQW